MKITLITSIIFLLSYNILHAQDTITRLKVYKSWINLMSSANTIEGNLYEVEDSSIMLSESIMIQEKTKLIREFDFSTIPFNDIKVILLRNRRKIGSHIFFGALAGFVVGISIGFLKGDTPAGLLRPAYTAEDNAMIYGVPSAIYGGLIGSFFGSFKIKLPINGDFNTFNGYRDKLEHYSIVDQTTYRKSRSKK